MRAFSDGQKRVLVFGSVGVVCFALQFVLLTLMVHLAVYRPVANAAAFAISAQLNFLLSSRLTWRDRHVEGRRGAGARWLAYNATALVSLGCNTAVFTLSYRSIGTTPAAALGVLGGTCLVYIICNFLVFRGTRPPTQSAARAPEIARQTATDRAALQ